MGLDGSSRVFHEYHGCILFYFCGCFIIFLLSNALTSSSLVDSLENGSWKYETFPDEIL